MNTVAQPIVQFTCPHCQAHFDAQISLAMKPDVLVPEALDAEVRAVTEGFQINQDA